MFLLAKPTEHQIRTFIESQRAKPFSYPASTAIEVPGGYKLDHHRIRLGSGSSVFEKAVKALMRWEMFNIGWVQLCWPDAPIKAGTTIAVLARHAGFWSLNACRIVFVIDEETVTRKVGFAYGTLPDHAERGQEAFTIEWRQEDDSVWYDILAYSRPNHFLARLGYPVTRLLQKRFARDSMEAMVRSSASG